MHDIFGQLGFSKLVFSFCIFFQSLTIICFQPIVQQLAYLRAFGAMVGFNLSKLPPQFRLDGISPSAKSHSPKDTSTVFCV
ncbi:hypothetical protein A9974_25535 [Achromobacter sp. UMC71]|nr:hypothetical protein [Achromobacter sp. UMC71]